MIVIVFKLNAFLSFIGPLYADYGITVPGATSLAVPDENGIVATVDLSS
jgi:hypothetical protein